MGRPVVDLLDPHFYVGDPHPCYPARLTLRVFFEELAARIQRIEPMAAPVYEANVFIQGVRRLDVRLHGRGDA